MLIVPDHESLDRRPVLPPNERRLSFGDKWSYAPAPEASNYIKLRPRYQLFINGKFVSPRSGKYFKSINPANEEKLAEMVYDLSASLHLDRRYSALMSSCRKTARVF